MKSDFRLNTIEVGTQTSTTQNLTKIDPGLFVEDKQLPQKQFSTTTQKISTNKTSTKHTKPLKTNTRNLYQHIQNLWKLLKKTSTKRHQTTTAPLYLPAGDGRAAKMNKLSQTLETNHNRSLKQQENWGSQYLSSDDDSFRSCSCLLTTVSPAQTLSTVVFTGYLCNKLNYTLLWF